MVCCHSQSADERARLGLFYAFQRPVAIPGVKMADFLRHATTNVRHPERKEGEAPAKFANAALRKISEHGAQWRGLELRAGAPSAEAAAR